MEPIYQNMYSLHILEKCYMLRLKTYKYTQPAKKATMKCLQEKSVVPCNIKWIM